MENEIEKLKKIYLETKLPKELEDGGFLDVLARIESSKTPFYYSRLFVIAVCVLLFVSGVTGLTFASSPNTPLYPVKIAAQNAVSAVAKNTPKEVRQAVERFVELKKPTPTLTPTISTPTPTLPEKTVNEPQNEHKGKETEEFVPTSTPRNNSSGYHQDVKGVSTTKTQEQSQNNSNNQSSNSSNSSDNEHNNNSQQHQENNPQNQSSNSSHSSDHPSNRGKD